MTTWHPLNPTNPQALTEGRLQLHYAIQFIAATGAALAEPLPDYSHTSLEWHPDLEVFIGATIRAEKPFRVAIDPLSLTLVILDRHHETIASFPLQDKTMAEGLSWLKQEISSLGANASKVEFLTYPPDDFPDHAIAHGATFNTDDAEALSELATYYANSHQAIQNLVDSIEDASSIRIWPHHFDLATLILLPGTTNGTPKTVGVGLSPGDPSYNEPYWYVSPYPYPGVAHLPALTGQGFWHTEHWVGAVLTASQLPQDGDLQTQQVNTFLESALQAARALLTSVDVMASNVMASS